MLDVEVIESPAAAAMAVDSIKSRLLAALAEPASAAALAHRLGIARQKINDHLRSLEDHGLVKVSAERQWGGLTERVMVASAASYVVSRAHLVQQRPILNGAPTGSRPVISSRSRRESCARSAASCARRRRPTRD
jgi:biotin operon repressor